MFVLLNKLKAIPTFARTFEIKYGLLFMEARKSDIAEDLQASNSLQGTSTTSCLRHICIAKFLLLWHNALYSLEEEASGVFGDTHIQDSFLLPASSEDSVLLLRAMHRYVTNPNKPNRDFPARPFYRVALPYVRALHVLYSLDMNTNAISLGLAASGIFWQ